MRADISRLARIKCLRPPRVNCRSGPDRVGQDARWLAHRSLTQRGFSHRQQFQETCQAQFYLADPHRQDRGSRSALAAVVSDRDQPRSRLQTAGGSTPEMARTVCNLPASPLRPRSVTGPTAQRPPQAGGARVDMEKRPPPDPAQQAILAAQTISDLARADIRGPYVNADGALLEDSGRGWDHFPMSRPPTRGGRRCRCGVARFQELITGGDGRNKVITSRARGLD